MTKTKQPETKTVTYEQMHNPEFKPISRFFIRLATGDYLFIKGQRKTAEKYIKEEFGSKYTLRTL